MTPFLHRSGHCTSCASAWILRLAELHHASGHNKTIHESRANKQEKTAAADVLGQQIALCSDLNVILQEQEKVNIIRLLQIQCGHGEFMIGWCAVLTKLCSPLHSNDQITNNNTVYLNHSCHKHILQQACGRCLEILARLLLKSSCVTQFCSVL